jgi:hypothetical protein
MTTLLAIIAGGEAVLLALALRALQACARARAEAVSRLTDRHAGRPHH